MPVDQLSEVIALLAALSVASERLVEIVKSIIPILQRVPPPPTNPSLSPTELREAAMEAAKDETRRQAKIQLLAVVSGIVTTGLAWPMVGGLFKEITGFWNDTSLFVAVGILASGGSGFWNSIQSYLLAIKDIQKRKALAGRG